MAADPHPSAAPRKTPWSHLLVRVLAAIGVLLIFERTRSHTPWTTRPNSEHGLTAFDSSAGSNRPTTWAVSELGPSVNDFTRKAIIVASIQLEDTQWIYEAFPGWEIYVYVVDDKTAKYTVYKDDGRESAVYLTYIINHYYNLPDYMVFMHATRYQWHNDDPMYDGIPVVRNLQLDNLDREGYSPLRCPHKPGCLPAGVDTTRKDEDGLFLWHNAYKAAFKEFFPEKEVPPKVAAPCCSSFAVSKSAVLARPPSEYEHYRHWLWTTNIGSGKLGRIFEYMWHIIFHKPAVFCPPAEQCYCKTWGYCDLKCPNATKCYGRYEWPEKVLTGIPDGWPENGQGFDGLPVDHWWQKWYPPSEYEHFHLRPNATHLKHDT